MNSKIKKVLSIAVLGVSIFTSSLGIASNSNEIWNKQVPLRQMYEAMGAKVSWDNNTQSIVVTRKNTTVKLKVGSDKAMVNGKEVQLKEKVKVVNGVTVVTVKTIEDTLGNDEYWQDQGDKYVKPNNTTNNNSNQWNIPIYKENKHSDKIKEVEKYLNDNFSKIETPLGTYNVEVTLTNNFRIPYLLIEGFKNNSSSETLLHEDKFKIEFKGSDVSTMNSHLNDVRNLYSEKAKKETKRIIENHAKNAAEYVSNSFSDSTVYGEYSYSYFRYKYIREGFEYLSLFEFIYENDDIKFERNSY